MLLLLLLRLLLLRLLLVPLLLVRLLLVLVRLLLVPMLLVPLLSIRVQEILTARLSAASASIAPMTPSVPSYMPARGMASQCEPVSTEPKAGCEPCHLPKMLPMASSLQQVIEQIIVRKARQQKPAQLLVR
jgi:hypothetical protein